MIDSLLKCGISKKTIDKISENHSLEYNLWCNLDDCKQIIEYLQSIGIMDIDNLLIYKPDIFVETKEDIETLFNKKMSINEFVNLINDNYTNIDLLFE